MLVYDALLDKEIEQIDDENKLVLPLNRASPEFNRLYHEERMNKLGEILWRVDPTMETMRAITAKDAYGITYPIIYMKDSNVSLDDAFIVAHEIMHLVLNDEGKTLIIYGKNPEITDKLQTMLEDSIVDSILQNKYGFNALKQYEMDFEATRHVFVHPGKEPEEQLERIYLAIILSNTILKLRIIKERDNLKDLYAFLEGYKHLYPNVSIISDQILSIVDEVGGLESIEQKKSVFFKISEKYNLGDILTINPPK